MEQSTLTIAEINKRVVKSFFSLTARQVALRAISFITLNIVLAKVLPVQTIGIFNIATSIVTFFVFFSDIGLAASLIQKKDEVTTDDIHTVFTIQQCIVGILSLIIIFAAPLAGHFYNFDDSGIWLIRILGVVFFLSSLKVIPSVMLERELKFHPIVMVEVVEAIIFNGLLVLLVFQNFGIWSFSVAVLTKSLVGVVLIYRIAPVKIAISFKKGVARQLLSFGVPFQANSLLALLKDRLVPLVVAGMVGPLGMGYITWAQSVAFIPIEIMSSVIRITFPAFSRLQDDKDALGKALEKSVFVTTFLVFPTIFGLAAILPSVVAFVVSEKWQPAIPLFYLFSFTTLWATISTTFTNALNAVGQIKITLKLMIFWTVLEWLLTPILTLKYGIIGVGIAAFLISFTSVITIFLVKRVVKVKIIDSVLLPLSGSMIMGFLIFVFSHFFVRDQLSLLFAIFLGGLIYISFMLVFGRKRVLADLKSLKKNA